MNSRLVLAMRNIGKGHSGALMFSSVMDLPSPVTSTPWARYTEHWTDVAGGVLNDQFDEANQRARETRQPDLGGRGVISFE